VKTFQASVARKISECSTSSPSPVDETIAKHRKWIRLLQLTVPEHQRVELDGVDEGYTSSLPCPFLLTNGLLRPLFPSGAASVLLHIQSRYLNKKEAEKKNPAALADYSKILTDPSESLSKPFDDLVFSGLDMNNLEAWEMVRGY
jgi:hypothetical protein